MGGVVAPHQVGGGQDRRTRPDSVEPAMGKEETVNLAVPARQLTLIIMVMCTAAMCVGWATLASRLASSPLPPGLP
jgi:hypothetical protein